jgi:putative membrane protein
MIEWMDLLNVSIYSIIGIILMQVAVWGVDLVIPCSFPEEIKKKNNAVGFLMAGVYIGIGLIMRSVIASPAAEAADTGLVVGLVGTLVYFFIGVIFCILGYLAMNLIHRKYNLNKEIGDGNQAAGIMVAGLFIGIAAIVSGVVA